MNALTDFTSWIDPNLYPFKNKFVSLSAGNMHFIDEGKGDIILFVHGTPTWSFLYRDFIKHFSKTHRCIAIDHIGFGLSDKPRDFDGTPKDHASNLVEFIKKLELFNITLVVHDFGGPIGLAAGIECSNRIKQVIVFNTWLWETKSNPEIIKIDKLLNGWVGKFMYLNMNASPKVLLKKAFSDKNKLTKEIHKHYLSPFPTKASRWSLLNLGRSLAESSDWYQLQESKIATLSNKPWLIIWGMKDAFIKPSYLERWKSMVPNAKVKELESGHFVQEEQTEEAIKYMSDLIITSE